MFLFFFNLRWGLASVDGSVVGDGVVVSGGRDRTSNTIVPLSTVFVVDDVVAAVDDALGGVIGKVREVGPQTLLKTRPEQCQLRSVCPCS